MPTLAGITAHLITNNTALVEYPDRTPNQEPQTSTSYIAVQSNKLFSIYLRIPPSSPALLFKVIKDGRYITQKPHTPRDGEKVYIHSEQLKFPYVVEDTSTNEPGDAQLWEDSEVVLQICHAKVVEPAGEDATAGRVEALKGPEHVFAITWKYRPLAVLKGIVAPRLPDSVLGLPPEPDKETLKRMAQQGPFTYRSPPPSSSSTAPAPQPSEPKDHPADHAWKSSTRSELWCTCRKVRRDEVAITCDNDDCEIQTYHLGCLGLESVPKSAIWLCPKCRLLPVSELRMEGQTEGLGPFDEAWIGKRWGEWF